MSSRIAVHDPRGYPPKVAGKRLAPRLESLDGKIVYLVDCLFDNSEAFMEQLRRWFAEHLPTVEHAHHQAARKLGRRPGHAREGRGGWRRRHPRCRALKHLLAPRSWGWPWRWKRRGVPTVAVHTHVFARLAQVDRAAPTACRARARRSCRSRSSIVSPEQLRGYIEGTDPITAPAVHAGGDRGADAAARRGRSQGLDLRALDAAAARARHRRQSAGTVHPQRLDRLPADHPADRRTRRRACSRARAIRPTRSSAGCARPRSANSGSSRSRRSRSTP